MEWLQTIQFETCKVNTYMYYTFLDVQRLWYADADFAHAKGNTECATAFDRIYTVVILQDHFFLE